MCIILLLYRLLLRNDCHNCYLFFMGIMAIGLRGIAIDCFGIF